MKHCKVLTKLDIERYFPQINPRPIRSFWLISCENWLRKCPGFGMDFAAYWNHIAQASENRFHLQRKKAVFSPPKILPYICHTPHPLPPRDLTWRIALILTVKISQPKHCEINSHRPARYDFSSPRNHSKPICEVGFRTIGMTKSCNLNPLVPAYWEFTSTCSFPHSFHF